MKFILLTGIFCYQYAFAGLFSSVSKVAKEGESNDYGVDVSYPIHHPLDPTSYQVSIRLVLLVFHNLQ